MTNPFPLPPSPKAAAYKPTGDAPSGHDSTEPVKSLMPFAELCHALTDYEKQRVDPETGQVLTVEKIKVDIPIELRVNVDDVGQVTLRGSAPTQRTETSVLPTFHQMQLTVVEVRHGE